MKPDTNAPNKLFSDLLDKHTAPAVLTEEHLNVMLEDSEDLVNAITYLNPVHGNNVEAAYAQRARGQVIRIADLLLRYPPEKNTAERVHLSSAIARQLAMVLRRGQHTCIPTETKERIKANAEFSQAIALFIALTAFFGKNTILADPHWLEHLNLRGAQKGFEKGWSNTLTRAMETKITEPQYLEFMAKISRRIIEEARDQAKTLQK